MNIHKGDENKRIYIIYIYINKPNLKQKYHTPTFLYIFINTFSETLNNITELLVM